MEKEAGITAGNLQAKDWQAEARKTVEKTVRLLLLFINMALKTLK